MPASYKIPQNVDLEDKIFGPFTLKQFLYLLGGGLATFITFNMFWQAAPAAFYVSALFIWVITIAFVFVRPNDQPFSKFIFAYIWFTSKPQRRVWKRLPTLAGMTMGDETLQKAEPADLTPSGDEVRSRLQRLAHIVDTRGWSDVEGDEPDIAARVTGGESKARLNIFMGTAEQPEDILAKEDADAGSDRTSAELDRALSQGVQKPVLNQQSQPATPTRESVAG